MAEGGAPPPEAMRGGVSTAIVAVVVVVVAVIAFVAGGFVLGPVFTPPTGRPEVLTIGTNTPFPPFMLRNATTDEVEGHDIDIITEVMSRMNQDFELVDFRDFDFLLASVAAGRVDVVAAGVTSSGTTGAARNETMDFSDIYFESDQGILVRDGEDPTTCAASGCVPADFTGLSIATQSATTSEFWVLDFVTEASPPIAGATLITFPDVTQVLLALQAADVDVVVIDKPAAEGFVAASPNVYDVVGTIETDELLAFAVQEGDPFNLLPEINAALAAIFADGTYDTIFAKWFGS